MKNTNDIIASVLTPPGTGAIAVIQVAGHDAATLLRPLLVAGRHTGIDGLSPDTLRLARLTDASEPIDDVLVVWRRDASGRSVVDLNLHGGAWIVQRTLLLLKRAGARIVDPAPHARLGDEPHTTLATETTAALLTATTRPLARMIARGTTLLSEEVRALIETLNAGRLAEAQTTLTRRCREAAGVARLLAGFRIVLTGNPNSGKSTLANLLEGREAALVSPYPGTTRDWTEHPAAIDGVPFTFVDTAGLRTSTDPIERQAMERGLTQGGAGDAVLHLIDASAPLDSDDRLRLSERSDPGATGRWIPVWNKCDLPPHPSHGPFRASLSQAGLSISARTGSGIDGLRARLLEVLGLIGWREWAGAPYTDRQRQAYGRALSALQAEPPDPQAASEALNSILTG